MSQTVQSTASLLLFFAMTATGPCLAEPNSPRLFAPGVISGPADDLSPAFGHDGATVVFTRGNRSSSALLESHLTGTTWSQPAITPFSGEWNDFEPTMAPDGSFLVFASNRPAAAGGQAIDGTFNGTFFKAAGGNLWRVDRTKGTWGKPYRLPDTINESTATFSPSIAGDGSVYFMHPDPKTGRFHLYRSQYQSGTYLPAVRVPIGSDETEDVDPAVSADERYIVFSQNKPAEHHPKRLMIAFRQKDGWSEPKDLGDEVNEEGSNIEARLSPDGKTLYFSTNTVPPVTYPKKPEDARRSLEQMGIWANGSENIWYVSLQPWLNQK